MTRKEAHAEAVAMLTKAAEMADQAHAMLRDARTDGTAETGRGAGRITARSVVGTLQGLAQSALEAECDDCFAPIAQCQCAWSNAEVGGRKSVEVSQ